MWSAGKFSDTFSSSSPPGLGSSSFPTVLEFLEKGKFSGVAPEIMEPAHYSPVILLHRPGHIVITSLGESTPAYKRDCHGFLQIRIWGLRR